MYDKVVNVLSSNYEVDRRRLDVTPVIHAAVITPYVDGV